MRQSGDQVRITAQLIDARDRLSPLVGNLRPPDGGHLRGAGRDRDGDRRQAADRARAQGAAARAARQGADPERRGLRALPAGPGDLEAPRRGQPAARHRAVPVRARRAIPAFARAHAALASAYVVLPGYTQEKATRRSTCRWPSSRRGRRWRSIRTSARRTPCWRRSTPSAATCSTPSPASSSRSRSSRTSRRRTTGIRSCCRRSAASTPRSSRRDARTSSTRARRCSRRTSPTST